MENFIVSARKYRPGTFGSVVGQSSITTTLKNAIKNSQLAHAYLFCGPRGVGKTTCARIFAKTINCQNVTDDTEPCGECESCKSFGENRSYNIHELDAASNNSVEDIRGLIEQVRIPPQLGKYSVYIIDEVHMLSQAAFNAFLKTLEEPPRHARFILATTEKHKILPTILSRCQIFDFNRMSVENIVNHLTYVAKKEKIAAEADALNIIAQKADGAMRDALSIFDQIVSFSGKDITYEKVIDNLNVLDYDFYFRLTDYFLSGKIAESLLIFDEILRKGFDGHHFVSGLSSHLRDLLVCTDVATIQLLEVGANIREKYKEQAQKCSIPFLFKALQFSNQCDIQYKAAGSQRLLVELMLLNICNIKNEEERKKAEVAQKMQQTVVVEKNTPEASTNAAATTADDNQQKSATTFSLKNAMKNGYSSTVAPPKKEIENIVAESVAENKPQTVAANSSFTPELLLNKWSEFTKTQSPRYASILQTHIPKLNGSTQVEFEVNSEITLETFNKELREKLTIFLRKELKNNSIEISALVNKKAASSKPYTQADKYKYLREQNPSLEKLREMFNLDFI